jgi:hypothetical protein
MPIGAPSDAVRASSPTGDVLLWEPAPGVIVHLVSGVVSLPLGVGIADFFRPIVEQRTGVQSFADYREASGYDREAREFLTDFTQQYLPSFAAINILLGSNKILSLGIGLYKLALGERVVRTYTDEEDFVRAMRAAGAVP